MGEVLQNQSDKRPMSLWKRIIRENARFRILRKASTRKAEREGNSKGIKNCAAKSDQLHPQNFGKHGCLKSGTQENINPPQKMVTVKDIRSDESANSDKACRKTVHISTPQSPESSRRNAICEVIEKQYIDHACNQQVNLSQKRDCLRVEYVLREVCLL
ncbi:Hypothetical predicted protein [Paramuricea clavata]|uniref:Uncharacterized protein n=1 Tax=Paramuricea clavata TaxID=317549 RepID=A0A7D9IZX8_PARCT|nr:Hypothetical predicted protein [Paramuricea clavata]